MKYCIFYLNTFLDLRFLRAFRIFRVFRALKLMRYNKALKRFNLAFKIVKEEMMVRSKLIEHVGQRIVKRIHSEMNNIHFVRLKVIKICPPINGDVDNVAIIIEE